MNKTKFKPVPTQLGLKVLRSKEAYYLKQFKQLEYQKRTVEDEYLKARSEREDFYRSTLTTMESMIIQLI